MAYTMADFKRDFVKKYFPTLNADERLDVLQSLPLEELLAGFPTDQLQQYLQQRTTSSKDKPRKPRWKK